MIKQKSTKESSSMSSKKQNKNNEPTTKGEQPQIRSTLITSITTMSILTLSIILYYFLTPIQSTTKDKPEFEPPTPHKSFESVTFGSIIKLTHESGFKLHSLNAQYGSGSGQQIVTGINKSDDHDSFWIVKNGYGKKEEENGTPIPCGSTINLQHLNTKSNLHSHLHESPLSNNQEVSCFAGNDAGDNWQLICKDKYWKREEKVQFKHVDTSKFLASNIKHVFPHPISGQLEIFAANKKDQAYWMAQEGVYFANNLE